MNSTATGIIIASAVMLIVSTTVTSIIQAYAAGITSSLKDNLQANLGKEKPTSQPTRQLHQMQLDAPTDVGQGTLGNDNSVSGFADQSRTNTTTANAPTSGPAGYQ